MTYQGYINSGSWRDNPARLAELKAADFRCRLCYASKDDAQLEVHHRTYARLGREQVGDLITLCKECHHIVTDMLRRRRYCQLHPRFADVIPALEDKDSPFDGGRS
jgi:5-methylcytosine-specific restriction endonuclease McrA